RFAHELGLELVVEGVFDRVVEVPIFFAQRQLGYSKLSFREQLRYIQHLRRLFAFKYPFWSYLLQFAVVGGTGVIVNLAVLTLLLSFGVTVNSAVIAAIAVS